MKIKTLSERIESSSLLPHHLLTQYNIANEKWQVYSMSDMTAIAKQCPELILLCVSSIALCGRGV